MHESIGKMERIKALNIGKDIQSLLNEAYEILGNPIVMFKTGYSLLAYTENIVTDDPLWNELISQGTFSYETQKLFAEEGFVDAVANAKTVAFLGSKKLKYDRLSGKLFNKSHVHVANLVMMACKKPFDDNDPALFEAICDIFSQGIAGNEFYQTYGKVHQETYIRRLVDGTIDEKGLYAADLSILYDGLKNFLHLAVVELGRTEVGDTKLSYFKDLFMWTNPAYKYSVYANKIIIVISTDSKSLKPHKDLNELEKLLNENDLYAGISSCFENLFKARKYYLEAVAAVDFGLKSKSSRHIVMYDEIPFLA